MKIHIRNAKPEEYGAVEAIMKQVQQMHIDWRPDIYRYSDTVLPADVFEQAVKDETFFVAEYEGIVAGILFIMYRHIEGPNQSVIFCGQFNTCLSASFPAPAFRFCPLSLSYLSPALWTILRYCGAGDVFNTAHCTILRL